MAIFQKGIRFAFIGGLLICGTVFLLSSCLSDTEPKTDPLTTLSRQAGWVPHTDNPIIQAGDHIAKGLWGDPFVLKEKGTKAFMVAKWVQAFIGFLFLLAVLSILQYSDPMIRVGAIGGISLFVYAGILAYRALFQTRMLMERDVLAEVIGTLAMVPLIWYACLQNSSLDILIACYVASRIVFSDGVSDGTPGTYLGFFRRKSERHP